ncbi:hypothetical protein EVG20_g8357, partial [Dentipellis fragilis]
TRLYVLPPASTHSWLRSCSAARACPRILSLASPSAHAPAAPIVTAAPPLARHPPVGHVRRHILALARSCAPASPPSPSRIRVVLTTHERPGAAARDRIHASACAPTRPRALVYPCAHTHALAAPLPLCSCVARFTSARFCHRCPAPPLSHLLSSSHL